MPRVQGMAQCLGSPTSVPRSPNAEVWEAFLVGPIPTHSVGTANPTYPIFRVQLSVWPY